MSQNPGSHESSKQDPLAQNNLLRETINAMPRRHTPNFAELEAFMSRTEKSDRDEYRDMLRARFISRLEESYATPSLQRYALTLFEYNYDRGLRHDAMIPFDNRNRPTNPREEALLVLADTTHPNSAGLYDL